MLYSIGIFLTLTVILVTALEPVENFAEGSCSKVPLPSVKIDPKWVNSLEYIAGGSKYSLYFYSSHAPNYPSMDYEEFYYDACLTRNTSGLSPKNSVAGIFGFGQLLASFDIISPDDNGTYVEAVRRSRPPTWGGGEERIGLKVTLTDNKSFAVLAFCRKRLDERGWVVVTNTPKLDKSSRGRIEDHVGSLGFKKENFVFIRYDSCHWKDPFVDYLNLSGRRARARGQPQQIPEYK